MKCIVKNEKFEVIEVDSDKTPSNYVIKHQVYNTWSSSYQLANSDIKIVWTNGTYQGDKVLFYYEDILLKEISSPQIQSVCDYINKYDSMSKTEVKELVTQAQNIAKDKLELEIENLTDLRNKIQNEIQELKSKINSL